MRFSEVIDEFKEGAAIKRKHWDYTIVYNSHDSISLECVLADDWELMTKPASKEEILKRRIEIYAKSSLDLMHEMLKDLHIVLR